MLSMVQVYNLPNIFRLLRGKKHCRALFTTVSVCLDHDSFLVMWTPRNLELEALDLLHYIPVDGNRGVLGPPFPIVHDG
jgi:ribulose-5-phosphate 4-epimerase/fuculose-1-phosphate aldolase